MDNAVVLDCLALFLVVPVREHKSVVDLFRYSPLEWAFLIIFKSEQRKGSPIRAFIANNLYKFSMHMPFSHRMARSRRTLGLLLCLSILLWSQACTEGDETANLPKTVDFNFHIRPILSNNCYSCHGPDASSRKAGLRLDTYEGATALLKSGAKALVPHHPKKSGLLQRITSQDEDLIMPPLESKKELSEREIALLKKWIKQGAEWAPYWAFQPPKPYSFPKKFTAAPVPEKIDYFIDEKLKEQGLSASSKADKTTLIRRLAYLLTGLPPSPKEINNFLVDDTPEAYTKVVDHYLASPHFGERWARHWMDLVRFAETRGHEFDYPVIGAWHYRDYLIRAFNQDLPYNQFLTEQLAGDLLAEARWDSTETRNESAIATCFYTLGEGTHSPVDVRQDEADRIDNIIDVTSKALQGLTVACSRCHDHKFDPIPTTDYYAWYGIFESSRFAMVPAGTGKGSWELMDSLSIQKEALKRFIAEQAPLTSALKVNQSTNSSAGKLTEDTNYQLLGDFRQGGTDNWDARGLAFQTPNALGEPLFSSQGQLQGFESGKISSHLIGTGLQGAVRSPSFTIDRDKILVQAAGVASEIRVIIDNLQLIQYPIHGGLRKELKNNQLQDHVFDVSMWKGRKAYVELVNGHYRKNGQNHKYDIPAEAWLEATYALLFDSIPPTLPKLVTAPSLPQKAIQNWLQGQPTLGDVLTLNRLAQKRQLPLNTPLYQTWVKAKSEAAQILYDSTYVAGVVDGSLVQSQVFTRGDYRSLSSFQVPHRFLSAVTDSTQLFPNQGSDRLALAEAITNPDNPLTGRVMVNRVWHHLFGQGLVKTVDNFGLQGFPPSHPALLDYLALQFIEEGWSLKRLIKNIVQTEVFQRSAIPSAGEKQDPRNLYLSKFPVRRIEAEAIRDALLATSGQLDKEMYGPPVPIYLTEFMKGRGRPAKSGPLNGENRRSIYQGIRRNFLSPFMLSFDMPVPFSCFGKRDVSNVPSQSLTLMNDPLVWQQAELWATEISKAEGPFEEKIEGIFWRAFARAPSASEIEEAKGFFAEIEGQTPTKEEAWSSYCHTIFNMKEFIFLL